MKKLKSAIVEGKSRINLVMGVLFRVELLGWYFWSCFCLYDYDYFIRLFTVFIYIWDTSIDFKLFIVQYYLLTFKNSFCYGEVKELVMVCKKDNIYILFLSLEYKNIFLLNIIF